MIEEMIDSIIQAEDKAQEIVKASVSQANNIVNEAKKQAEKMLVDAKDSQYSAEQSAVAKGERESAELREKQLAEAKSQAKAYEAALEKNKKKVADCIIKELKGRYGIK